MSEDAFDLTDGQRKALLCFQGMGTYHLIGEHDYVDKETDDLVRVSDEYPALESMGLIVRGRDGFLAHAYTMTPKGHSFQQRLRKSDENKQS